MQPIKLYSHASGPNPWKSVIIMLELGIPFESIFLDFKQVKEAPFVEINPNGRVPAIVDDNGKGIKLWESCAINEYLIDKYDTDKRLTYDTEPEKYHLKQWLYFQASGQGPYIGQLVWFTKFHEEQVESAKTRYKKEAKRIMDVLNRALEGREYLVGDKVTVADLAFVPWDSIIGQVIPEGERVDAKTEFPHYYAWQQRLMARPSVKKTFELREQALKESGH
ncbi:MAG: hypothetical protein M1823_004852 [Watsoniomyces obsoletus]|nr:MAG: hypothetical protein M1823_004852 [Watsoniomyces obsoletus]